jgi:hypothetical protein
MKIDSSAGTINLADPGPDQDDWIVIKSQSVTYDKNDFFINEFENDFPGYTLIGSDALDKFTFLSELCGRNSAMSKWFAATSLKYSNTTQLPLYLKDSVAPDEYKRVQEGLLVIKEKLAEVVKARNELSAKYVADLEKLKAREREVVKKTIGDDNILKIVSLSTESLPLSIQMKIQSYMANSPDADIADNRRRLAQEYLARFKKQLIDINSITPIKDIDALIDEISLK